jgi:hypothetical protein
MKTAFQPHGVWWAFGCNSMGLVVGTGRHVLLSGQVARDDQRLVVGVGDLGFLVHSQPLIERMCTNHTPTSRGV